MLKKSFTFFVVAVISLFFLQSPASGCVGRNLYVGARNTIQDRVLAQLLVVLINERTGTTVKIRLFNNDAKLYKALKSENKEDRVDIIVEDTKDAFTMLQQTPSSNDIDQQYLTVKNRYEKQLNIVWLAPFGFDNKIPGIKTVSAPLVRMDILTNFPLLPRVLDKLAGMVSDKTFTKLTASARDGENPQKVARDFLSFKKLI